MNCLPSPHQHFTPSSSFLGPLYNLARSESLHTSLKDLDLLDLCAAVLTGQPEGAVAEEVKVGAWGREDNVEPIP